MQSMLQTNMISTEQMVCKSTEFLDLRSVSLKSLITQVQSKCLRKRVENDTRWLWFISWPSS
jgi:hypothetical protein